ncbi:hypothetical protein ABZZ79_06295 [Streptomyces sp. NPDC006458]|uniref:hypothetical protein n=1 Tax=Streptomyces sp. NPDC006458 TaxID=3154302 RepID=UPI0033A9E964
MRRALLTPLLAAALTGCSLLGSDTLCTQADADSRVSAMWRPADFGGPDAVTIRFCVNGTCKERTSGPTEDPFAMVSVQLPDEIGAVTVPVRLTVTSVKNGDTVVEDSTRARLTARQPNGASCSPTVWTATFRAHPERGLTSPKGMKLQS